MSRTGDRHEDSSMMIYRAAREVLVNEQAAIEIAQALLKTRYGDLELQRQEPLSVEDAGDYWTITGCALPDFRDAQPRTLVTGRAEIEISKYDGRLWKFVLRGHFEPL